MTGQINLNSAAGAEIKKISEQDDVKTIVEIGTWNGLGSTSCVLDGIKYKEYSKFISLESNAQMFQLAELNNRDKNVQLIFGRIIEKNKLDTENLQGAEQQWLNQDLSDYENTPNVLHKIPDSIDFLILDGGEFSTREEFLILKERSKYIFLDDTTTRKNRINREELLKSADFETIKDFPTDRNGWAVFKKK